MKNYVIYYRFKGAIYRDTPMQTFTISEKTKKNAREKFLRMMEEGGMFVKVIRIEETT